MPRIGGSRSDTAQALVGMAGVEQRRDGQRQRKKIADRQFGLDVGSAVLRAVLGGVAAKQRGDEEEGRGLRQAQSFAFRGGENRADRKLSREEGSANRANAVDIANIRSQGNLNLNISPLAKKAAEVGGQQALAVPGVSLGAAEKTRQNILSDITNELAGRNIPSRSAIFSRSDPRHAQRTVADPEVTAMRALNEALLEQGIEDEGTRARIASGELGSFPGDIDNLRAVTSGVHEKLRDKDVSDQSQRIAIERILSSFGAERIQNSDRVQAPNLNPETIPLDPESLFFRKQLERQQRDAHADEIMQSLLENRRSGIPRR